ncbi:hypothetical protein OOT33_15875 [Sphingobium sp. DEHP117]|jgi:hypothetical protein|uniref:hypothetical protein n=1 Tax=Sphingobium sp. DEHP117 TaxID=2993436 RepID=UPI0027D4D667|nr:hypothetical protein [Sphingobium sp. DEHP117]MDQ4421900.1 hypothetical protein [Sphingobium sp. DEHP117]
MIVSRRTASHAFFSSKVETWITDAVADGIADYTGLLRRLPGVYPTELLASLERLAASRAIDPALYATARQEAKPVSPSGAEGRSLLPLPHPLDYEWRFTADASRALLNHAADLTPDGSEVLLFGTPGLAAEALTLPISRRMSLLVEPNSVTDRLVALNRATGSPLAIAFCSGGLPRDSADAVLLDPPWYLDFVRPMLTAAAHACRLGGFVLISLPPDGARPTAATDRQAAITLAKRLGLTLVERQPLSIAYETPFFERNALRAAGIATPPQWRRGDLLVFQRVAAPCLPAPHSHRRRLWAEVVIGRMRLFISMGANADNGDADLVSIVAGDVLPSVSRRDPRRSSANVWTSGNRVFRTNNPQLLLEAAISCAGEAMGSGFQPWLWGTLRGGEAIERVAAELRDLAALEAAEETGAPAETERSAVWRLSTTISSTGSTAIRSG